MSELAERLYSAVDGHTRDIVEALREIAVPAGLRDDGLSVVWTRKALEDLADEIEAGQ